MRYKPLGVDTRRDTDVALLYSWLSQGVSSQCQSTAVTAVGPTRRPKKPGTVGKTTGGRNTAVRVGEKVGLRGQFLHLLLLLPLPKKMLPRPRRPQLPLLLVPRSQRGRLLLVPRSQRNPAPRSVFRVGLRSPSTENAGVVDHHPVGGRGRHRSPQV